MKILFCLIIIIIIWMILMTICIADFNNIIKRIDDQQEFIGNALYETVKNLSFFAGRQRDILEILEGGE